MTAVAEENVEVVDIQRISVNTKLDTGKLPGPGNTMLSTSKRSVTTRSAIWSQAAAGDAVTAVESTTRAVPNAWSPTASTSTTSSLPGPGKFTRIKVCVYDNPVHFYDFDIFFRNGGHQDVRFARASMTASAPATSTSTAAHATSTASNSNTKRPAGSSAAPSCASSASNRILPGTAGLQPALLPSSIRRRAGWKPAVPGIQGVAARYAANNPTITRSIATATPAWRVMYRPPCDKTNALKITLLVPTTISTNGRTSSS